MKVEDFQMLNLGDYNKFSRIRYAIQYQCFAVNEASRRIPVHYAMALPPQKDLIHDNLPKLNNFGILLHGRVDYRQTAGYYTDYLNTYKYKYTG